MKNLGILEYFSGVAYLLLITYFLIVTARAAACRKKRRGEQGLIPLIIMISSANAILLISYDMVVSSRLSGHLVCFVGLAMVPVFLSELSDASVKVSVLLSTVVAVIAVLLLSVCRQVTMYVISICQWFVPMMTLVAASLIIVWTGSFSRDDGPSGRVFPWTYLQYVRTGILYFLIFLVLMMLGAYIGLEESLLSYIANCICLVSMILLFAVMCRRLADNRPFLLQHGFEGQFHESASGQADDAGMPCEDKGYHAIFDRLKKFFEEEHPFLDPDLSISDVSRSLFTNKAYLSRTINLYTGRNFRQYVNYHRIRYAVGLFHSDPSLKVADLAERSGFHTVNSFNMAFRLYMNMNPGEWCRKYKRDGVPGQK